MTNSLFNTLGYNLISGNAQCQGNSQANLTLHGMAMFANIYTPNTVFATSPIKWHFVRFYPSSDNLHFHLSNFTFPQGDGNEKYPLYPSC